jgi:signal transduction histidine kinase/ActR/RegA family two-component response regulator
MNCIAKSYFMVKTSLLQNITSAVMKLSALFINFIRKMMKVFAPLVNIGTKNVNDEALLTSIKITNILSITIAMLIILVGTILITATHNIAIGIPATIELTITCSVILLNYYKQHKTASLTLLTLQCVSAIYFTIIIGEALQLGSIIFFLMPTLFLLFNGTKERWICFTMAITTFIILEFLYAYNLVMQTSMNEPTQFTMNVLTNSGILILVMAVGKKYVRSNDIKYRLERDNHFKTIFTNEISHELRNNVNSIENIAASQRTVLQKGDSKENMEYLLNLLVYCCKNMRNTINNVLDMTQRESGKLEVLTENTFAVRPFFDEIINLHKISAKLMRSKIVAQFNDNLPDIIVADSIKLTQTIMNLLGNALKYGNPGSVINVTIQREEDKMSVAVTNECNDIPVEKQAALFDIYYTDKKNNKIEGSGIGLYTVKNKLAIMQGEINVTSQHGRTTFTIIFPFKPGNPKDLANEKNTFVDNLNNIHVLIADDDNMSVKLLSNQLKDAGCIISTTNNGLTLLNEAEVLFPDAILLDYRMPDLNGEDALKALKNNPKTRDIPVIMITGDQLKSSAYFLSAGATDVLLKPVDATTIKRTLSKYCQDTSNQILQS